MAIRGALFCFFFASDAAISDLDNTYESFFVRNKIIEDSIVGKSGRISLDITNLV